MPPAPPAAAASGAAPVPPRRRSRAWRLLVPVVFAAAGLLFATSFQTAAGTDLRSDRTLPELIDAGNRTVDARTTRLQQVQAEIDQLTAAQAPRDARVETLTRTAAGLAPQAGTQAVRGPVVTVTLDDSPNPIGNLSASVRPDDLVVHQQDVQAVVNALWRGGAEAMMIQDQRVIATSAVRCVGNTLILQGRVYSPPFTIRAMGPIAELTSALERDPQVAIYRQWVELVGLGYDVATSPAQTFPAYPGSVSLQYAEVVRAAETTR